MLNLTTVSYAQESLGVISYSIGLTTPPLFSRRHRMELTMRCFIPLKDDCIVLAPCAADETLPSDPRLPADLFTACLTTPISVALRDFVRRHPDSARGRLDEETVEAGVPGRLGDRKTPLGELNWIFTAITDSIAWNTLPRALFQQLFRPLPSRSTRHLAVLASIASIATIATLFHQ